MKEKKNHIDLVIVSMTLPNALMSALQEETYEAHVASQPMGSEDDVQEIIGTVECKMSDTSSSPKDPDTPSSPKKRRGRGRPRKLVDEVQAKKNYGRAQSEI